MALGAQAADPVLMDANLRALLERHAGAVRHMELARARIPAPVVQREVSQGNLVQLRRGVVCLPGAEDWGVARARGADVACVSAAKLLGLGIVQEPKQLHVQVRCPPLPGPYTVHKMHDGGLLGLLRQCANCLPTVEALVVLESAVTRRFISLDQLKGASRGLRATQFSQLVGLVNPGSESVPETVGRYVLESAGYAVLVQKHVEGLGRLDLLVEGILGIEIDGQTWHSDSVSFNEDRRRNNIAIIRGIPTMRFSYAMVMHHPEQFLELVRRGIQTVRSGALRR